eukprot:866977-Pyramimonas_sp.AAC.1
MVTNSKVVSTLGPDLDFTARACDVFITLCDSSVTVCCIYSLYPSSISLSLYLSISLSLRLPAASSDLETPAN